MDEGKKRDYRELGTEIGGLLNKKQEAYGNSFNEIPAVLKMLWPKGVPVDALDHVLTIARMLDKIWRVARQNDPFGESPYADIAGYALLAEQREKEKGLTSLDLRDIAASSTTMIPQMVMRINSFHAAKRMFPNLLLITSVQADVMGDVVGPPGTHLKGIQLHIE